MDPTCPLEIVVSSMRVMGIIPPAADVMNTSSAVLISSRLISVAVAVSPISAQRSKTVRRVILGPPKSRRPQRSILYEEYIEAWPFRNISVRI